MEAGTTKTPKPITAPAVFNSRRWALSYLSAFAAAELLTTRVSSLAGLVLYSLIFAALLLHASLGSQGPGQRFLLSLALVPLIRLLSLIIPLQQFPISLWYLLVGLPLSAGVYLAARQGRFTGKMLGLTWKGLPAQIAAGLAGIGIGYLEYEILRPDPLIPEFQLFRVLAIALILLIFSGLLEEVIFRGAIQYAAIQTLGRAGLLYSIAVFVLLHIGSRSSKDLLFIAGVGICFSWLVFKTGSIVGTSLAHGLANISLYLIFPFLLAGPINTPTSPEDLLSPALLAVPSLEAKATITPSAPTAAQPEAAHRTLLSPTATAVLASVSPAPTLETLVAEPTQAGATLQSTPNTISETMTVLLTADQQPATEQPPPARVETCRPPAGWVVYRIRSGDTLYSLGRVYGISVSRLQEANCLRGTNRIFSGQQLWVPFRLPDPSVTPVPTRAPVATMTPIPRTATQTPMPPTSTPPPSATPVRATSTQPATPTHAPTEIPTVLATLTAAGDATEAFLTQIPAVDTPQP